MLRTGAEIVARLGEDLFDVLRSPVRRVSAPSVPMPFSPDLEQALLPQVTTIAAACDQLVQEG